MPTHALHTDRCRRPRPWRVSFFSGVVVRTLLGKSRTCWFVKLASEFREKSMHSSTAPPLQIRNLDWALMPSVGHCFGSPRALKNESPQHSRSCVYPGPQGLVITRKTVTSEGFRAHLKLNNLAEFYVFVNPAPFEPQKNTWFYRCFQF